MVNDLQYAAAQLTPYLVVVAGRLLYVGDDLAELVVFKSKHDELMVKVWVLEEQCKFDERLLVLSVEKSDVEDQLEILDGEVNCLSQ